MLYDFDYYIYRPLYYSRPQYYTSYSPGYYLGDNYYRSYRYYTPSYRTPAFYTITYPNLPYRRYYDYSIPDYSYKPFYTKTLPSKTVLPAFPESQKYAFTYGSDFDSTAKDIRSTASKLLKEIHQYVPRASSLPRVKRASSCSPLYDSDIDYYKNRRALTLRMMSEEPRPRINVY